MSVRSSQRSSVTASSASGSSRRTASSSYAGTGSTRSITSSVALEQLRQLDDVLLRERQAREEAERTLQILQQERAEKNAATRRSEKTERQLNTILSSLNRVLDNPDDAKKLRQLQRVAIDNATSSERSTVSSYRTGDSSSSSTRSSNYTSSSYHSNSSSSNRSRSSSSSSKKKRGDEKKIEMISAGQTAMLAAGGGAGISGKYKKSSDKSDLAKETFFDKFGLGDERQKRAIDRSYFGGEKDGMKAAGKTSAATSKIPSVLPKGVPAHPNSSSTAAAASSSSYHHPSSSSSKNPAAKKVDAKNLMNSSVAFTHQKSDLMPTY